MPVDELACPILFALSPLTPSGEGLYLAATADHEWKSFTGHKLRVWDIAHVLLFRDEEVGELRLHVHPVLGFDDAFVDVTNYTAVGEMKEPILSHYLVWLEARAEEQKNDAPEVEDLVHRDGS